MSPRSSSRTSGSLSLPLLIALLGLTVVLQSLVELTAQIRTAAAAHRRILEAESAVEGVLRHPPLDPVTLLGLPLGGALASSSVRLSNGSRVRLAARRLSTEVFAVDGQGRDSTSAAASDLGRVAWIPDPQTRLEAFQSVVRTGRGLVLSAGASVGGVGAFTVPPSWPASVCAPTRAAVARALPVPLAPSTAMPAGWVPSAGPFDVHEWVARVPPVSGPVVSPSPSSTGGGCSGSSSNWGSPSDPTGPCGARFALRGATGSLGIAGGEGQGVLFVGGDLRLGPGVWFSGVAFVGGDVELEAGARLDGFVLAGGAVRLAAGGVILGSGCAALRALQGTLAPWPVEFLPEGGWIEPW